MEPTSPQRRATSIRNIGILAIDGNEDNDRLRLYEFSITGTAVPEPAVIGLLSLGVLGLLGRRRRV